MWILLCNIYKRVAPFINYPFIILKRETSTYLQASRSNPECPVADATKSLAHADGEISFPLLGERAKQYKCTKCQTRYLEEKRITSMPHSGTRSRLLSTTICSHASDEQIRLPGWDGSQPRSSLHLRSSPRGSTNPKQC